MRVHSRLRCYAGISTGDCTIAGHAVLSVDQGVVTMDGTICLLEGECKGERDFIEFPPQPAMMWWLAHR